MTVRHVFRPSCKSITVLKVCSCRLIVYSAFAQAYPDTVDSEFEKHWFVGLEVPLLTVTHSFLGRPGSRKMTLISLWNMA